jgi:hypothetical protein
MLREAEQLPRDLSDLALAGIEALSYLATDVSPAVGWRDSKMAMLEQVAKPKAEVEFAVVGSVRKLVILAAEKSNLRGIPHSELKERVSTMADKGTR